MREWVVPPTRHAPFPPHAARPPATPPPPLWHGGRPCSRPYRITGPTSLSWTRSARARCGTRAYRALHAHNQRCSPPCLPDSLPPASRRGYRPPACPQPVKPEPRTPNPEPAPRTNPCNPEPQTRAPRPGRAGGPRHVVHTPTPKPTPGPQHRALIHKAEALNLIDACPPPRTHRRSAPRAPSPSGASCWLRRRTATTCRRCSATPSCRRC